MPIYSGYILAGILGAAGLAFFLATNKKRSRPAPKLGCQHYERACEKQCPNALCQGKYYACRLCHDAYFDGEVGDPKLHHMFDRHAVTRIRCLRCKTEQPVARTCTKCGKDFAKYFCATCRFYDDKGDEKKVFHCDKCGICRVGGRENFFHCETCGACLALALKDNHTCKA